MIFKSRSFTDTRDALAPHGVACAVLGLFALAMTTGCGESRPERVPVSGVVVIDGKPLPNCHVQFVPPNGRASRGQTDAEGRFTLTCYEDNDGVLLGTQRVSVTAFKELDGVTILWNAPKKYMDHKTSEISFDIEEPQDDLKIELTWNGDQPFVERNGKLLKGGLSAVGDAVPTGD